MQSSKVVIVLPSPSLTFVKLCSSTIFCIVALLTLCSQSVQADPVLRGYWTFDTDTVASGKAVESSGYEATNHDATLTVNNSGVAFKSIEGEAGNHLSSGNYIQFTNDSYAVVNNSTNSCYDFNGSSFTISAWVKGLPDGTWEPYISKNGENNYGYQLRRQGSNNYPTFTIRRTDGDDDPTPNISYVDTNLNDGEWHHLVGVYGGTYRELYMDGKLIMQIPDSAVNAGGTGESLVFSGRDQSGTLTAFANISLDDVSIYSGALSKSQISYISKGNSPTTIASAPAETVYISPSDKANSGLRASFSGKTSHSWLGDELTFNGSGYLNTNLSVNSLMNGSFTASAWVKLNSNSGDQPIFGNSKEANNQGLHLIVRNGSPLMGFYGTGYDLTTSTTLDVDTWYYLTFMYDADTKTQSIYLNDEDYLS